MPRKKKPIAVQPALFDLESTDVPDNSNPEPLEPLEPGDVVLVDNDPSRQWIVVREIADHVSIWNDSESDCVERHRIQRLGKKPGMVTGYASAWLAKMIESLGYWDVMELLASRQPKSARVKDQLHIMHVSYSNSKARYTDIWQVYESDLEAVESMVNEFIDLCRDTETPLDQAVAALFDRHFGAREK